MAKQLELEVANFVCRFGDKLVLNDLLGEIVMNAESFQDERSREESCDLNRWGAKSVKGCYRRHALDIGGLQITLEDVHKPRIERIIRMKRSVTRLVAILRFVVQSPNRGKFGLNYLYDSGNGQSAKCSASIPLDFGQYTADTSVNTLAAPLFRQVKCPRNDVHQGRVPFSNNARFELHHITAAPPLMPFRHNAVLGRLLLFTHSILGRAASWAIKSSLIGCEGKSHIMPRSERFYTLVPLQFPASSFRLQSH